MNHFCFIKQFLNMPFRTSFNIVGFQITNFIYPRNVQYARGRYSKSKPFNEKLVNATSFSVKDYLLS